MSNHELNNHKKSDKIKWIIAFTLIAVLLLGMVAMIVTNLKDNEEKSEDDVIVNEQMTEITESNLTEVYAMPKTMAFTAQALAASTTASVDVRIEAYVYPTNAGNREVDYSVAWGSAPTHGSEAVSNYLTVTPDSDGSRLATVSCKKAFGSDKIIITATTRDGGYKANCTVSFLGVASTMSITSSTLSTVSSGQRGSCYELGTNKTYTFDINLNNSFNSVGTKDLTVTLGGSGSLYFGTTYASADWGVSSFQDYQLRTMEEMADRFITSATISGNTLTVKTGSSIVENYYSHYESDEYYTGTYTYDRYVYEDEFGLTAGAGYEEKAAENAANIPSCYFTITVTDNVSGLSQQIKVWVVASVSSVSFSQNSLMF